MPVRSLKMYLEKSIGEWAHATLTFPYRSAVRNKKYEFVIWSDCLILDLDGSFTTNIWMLQSIHEKSIQYHIHQS